MRIVETSQEEMRSDSMESPTERPQQGPAARDDVKRRIYVSREVTDIEIDLTVPRHIHVKEPHVDGGSKLRRGAAQFCGAEEWSVSRNYPR
jgi:hypothetical protein